MLVVAPRNIALPFFGIGAVLLLSGLAFCRALLRMHAVRPEFAHATLRRLGVQQAARRHGRSLAVIALLACGLFLVLSVASMREDLASHAHERSSGTGGFELFAEATVPIQDSLLAGMEQPGVEAVPVRVHAGDDASCLNLNYSLTPRLLGVDPQAFADLGAFERGDDSIWQLLERDLPNGEIPALVGDTDTAMWGLMAKTGPENGDTRVYQDESGEEVILRLVGSLPMRLSVFQGTLLISNGDFTRLYPSESGFSIFLIDTPRGEEDSVSAALRRKWGRHGLDVVPTLDRLRAFYKVESTYLAMFLVLGGLGVTLGGFGMGIVMLRNLFERRGELAMLSTLGFDRRAIRRLLLTEHGLLLLAGIVVGVGAAAVSSVPGVVISGTEVPIGLMASVVVLVAVSAAACMSVVLAAGLRVDTLDALRDE